MRRGSRKGATEAASWPQASAVFPAIDATLNRRWRERERKGGNLRERLTRITKRERERGRGNEAEIGQRGVPGGFDRERNTRARESNYAG